jgi:hypothetical protein
MADNIRTHLEPGEQFRYGFTGERGLSRSLEALGWVPGLDDAVKLLFIFTNRPRIVVITDRRIAVFSAGRLSRKKPKTLLYTLPRATRLEHGTRRRSTVVVGSESIRMERNAYGLLEPGFSRWLSWFLARREVWSLSARLKRDAY